MYCLRKLRSFGVNSDIIVTFYNAVIFSLIMFSSACWGWNISQFERGRLEKIVAKAVRIVGKPVDRLEALYEKTELKN